MYRQNKMSETSLERNESVEGETIEQKIERVVNNKEPITDGAPIIFTERKDGVQAAYDIRTDRFDVAAEAMNYVSKSDIAKRKKRIDERETLVKGIKDKEVGEPEIRQGNDEK